MAEGNVTYGPTGGVRAPSGGPAGGSSMREAAVARVARLSPNTRIRSEGGPRNRMARQKAYLEGIKSRAFGPEPGHTGTLQKY